jgi:hypothetical protein
VEPIWGAVGKSIVGARALVLGFRADWIPASAGMTKNGGVGEFEPERRYLLAFVIPAKAGIQ